MRRYDIAVVGAGPAGALTAHALAARGASVVLLDRASFPRDKPCGGGLTQRAVRQIPFPVERVVEDRVTRLDLRLGYGPSFHRRAEQPLVLMTQRLRLDALLVESAVGVGAELREGVRARRIERDGPGVVVRTSAGDVRADLAIGADGANGISAAAVARPVRRAYCVAFEGNVPYGHVRPDRYRGRAVLELGVVPGGYAWIFPKAGHVNVGVAGWESEGPRLRRHLAQLLKAHGIDMQSAAGLRGHRLPLRSPHAPLAGNGVLLVGDAAGLVDPLSGDGIYEAALSARHAADVAAGVLGGSIRSLATYGPTLLARTGALAAASWEWKHAYDRFPRLSFAVTRLPPAWPVIQALLRGTLVDPGAARGAKALPVLLLGLLGRAAQAPGAPYRREAAWARGAVRHARARDHGAAGRVTGGRRARRDGGGPAETARGSG